MTKRSSEDDTQSRIRTLYYAECWLADVIKVPIWIPDIVPPTGCLAFKTFNWSWSLLCVEYIFCASKTSSFGFRTDLWSCKYLRIQMLACKNLPLLTSLINTQWFINEEKVLFLLHKGMYKRLNMHLARWYSKFTNTTLKSINGAKIKNSLFYWKNMLKRIAKVVLT